MPHMVVPDKLKDHPLDAYSLALDAVADSGCNYLSLAATGNWTGLELPSPFEKDAYGKYDLESFSPLYRKGVRCLNQRAARDAVSIHWYPFEFVSFNHAEFWNRSPFNALKNNNYWITAGVHGAPRNYHQFHRAVKERDPAPAFEALKRFYSNMLRTIDKHHPHAVVPVLEGQSRTVDLFFSGRSRDRLLGSNLKGWWADEHWPQMHDNLGDPANLWRRLADRIDFVVCHSCGVDGSAERILTRLLPYAQEFNFQILVSDDGCGSGPLRKPHGSRHSVEDLVNLWRLSRQTLGGSFMGLEFKVFGWEDMLYVMPLLAGELLEN